LDYDCAPNHDGNHFADDRFVQSAQGGDDGFWESLDDDDDGFWETLGDEQYQDDDAEDVESEDEYWPETGYCQSCKAEGQGWFGEDEVFYCANCWEAWDLPQDAGIVESKSYYTGTSSSSAAVPSQAAVHIGRNGGVDQACAKCETSATANPDLQADRSDSCCRA